MIRKLVVCHTATVLEMITQCMSKLSYGIFGSHKIYCSNKKKVSLSSSSSIVVHVIPPFLQMYALIAEKASSMGLKSGEYDERNSYFMLLQMSLAESLEPGAVTY